MHPGEDDLLAHQAKHPLPSADREPPVPAPSRAIPDEQARLATAPPATVPPPADHMPAGTPAPAATPPPDLPALATRVQGIQIQQVATGAQDHALWQIVLTFDHGPRLLQFVQSITPGEFAQEVMILLDTIQQQIAQFAHVQAAQLAAQRALPPPSVPPAPPLAATRRNGKNASATETRPPAAPPPAPASPAAPSGSAGDVAFQTGPAPVAVVEQATLF
jgi:hypothetical protein